MAMIPIKVTLWSEHKKYASYLMNADGGRLFIQVSEPEIRIDRVTVEPHDPNSKVEFTHYGAMWDNKLECKIGSFYWIIPAFDPDTDEAWECGVQPARFAGYDSMGKQLWHCLDIEGPTTWAARWIGPEIVLSNE